MGEDDPEADPASEKADVHGIADIAVKADDHEVLRGSDGSGCTTAGPAEIPNATKGDCEAEDGGNCGEPAPASGVEGGGSEAQPNGKKPEPQDEESDADDERSAGGEPARKGSWNWIDRHEALVVSMQRKSKIENDN